jgi:regulator of RNase E activity RraA
VAIFPGDLIVADRDGAVVVPQAMAEAVLEASLEQEALEEWIMGEIRSGAALPGLYPPNEENRRRYDAARKP